MSVKVRVPGATRIFRNAGTDGTQPLTEGSLEKPCLDGLLVLVGPLGISIRARTPAPCVIGATQRWTGDRYPKPEIMDTRYWNTSGASVQVEIAAAGRQYKGAGNRGGQDNFAVDEWAMASG
jgi:hypothetical protein